MRNFNLRAVNAKPHYAMEHFKTPYEVALENFEIHVDGLKHHVAFAFKKNKTSIALEELGYSSEGFIDTIKDLISRLIEFFKNLFHSSPSQTETARVEKIKEKTETVKQAVEEKKVDPEQLKKLFAENESLVKRHSTVAVALLYTYDNDIHGGPQKILDLVKSIKEITTGFLGGMTPALNVLEKFANDPNMTKEQFDEEYGKVESDVMQEFGKRLEAASGLFDLGDIGKRLGMEEPKGTSLLESMRALKKIVFTPLEMDKDKMAKEVIDFNLNQPDKMLTHLKEITNILSEVDSSSFQKQLDQVLVKMKTSLEKISKKAGKTDTSENDVFLRSFSSGFGEMTTLISILVIFLNKIVKENTKAAEAIKDFIIQHSK